MEHTATAIKSALLYDKRQAEYVKSTYGISLEEEQIFTGYPPPFKTTINGTESYKSPVSSFNPDGI